MKENGGFGMGHEGSVDIDRKQRIESVLDTLYETKSVVLQEIIGLRSDGTPYWKPAAEQFFQDQKIETDPKLLSEVLESKKLPLALSATYDHPYSHGPNPMANVQLVPRRSFPTAIDLMHRSFDRNAPPVMGYSFREKTNINTGAMLDNQKTLTVESFPYVLINLVSQLPWQDVTGVYDVYSGKNGSNQLNAMLGSIWERELQAIIPIHWQDFIEKYPQLASMFQRQLLKRFGKERTRHQSSADISLPLPERRDIWWKEYKVIMLNALGDRFSEEERQIIKTAGSINDLEKSDNETIQKLAKDLKSKFIFKAKIQSEL